jgi:hypothetical protein
LERVAAALAALLVALLVALLAAGVRLNSFVNWRYSTASARLTRKKLPKIIIIRKYTSTHVDTASCRHSGIDA